MDQQRLPTRFLTRLLAGLMPGMLAKLLVGLWAVWLVGCVQLTEQTRKVFASRVDAHGVIQGVLLSGKLRLDTDRTGIVSLTSTSEPTLVCLGRVNFTATPNGVISLRCSDNAEISLNFTMSTETRGFATGQGPDGPASLAFGMPLEEARAYLRLPAGRQLLIPSAEEGGAPRLQSR